jgi:hypothetical protein
LVRLSGITRKNDEQDLLAMLIADIHGVVSVYNVDNHVAYCAAPDPALSESNHQLAAKQDGQIPSYTLADSPGR